SPSVLPSAAAVIWPFSMISRATRARVLCSAPACTREAGFFAAARPAPGWLMFFTTSLCRKSFPGRKRSHRFAGAVHAPPPDLPGRPSRPGRDALNVGSGLRLPDAAQTGAAMSVSQAARRMWTLFEPIHTVTYFAAEARAAFEAAGVRGFWRGYFAGRSAPL